MCHLDFCSLAHDVHFSHQVTQAQYIQTLLCTEKVIARKRRSIISKAHIQVLARLYNSCRYFDAAMALSYSKVKLRVFAFKFTILVLAVTGIL